MPQTPFLELNLYPRSPGWRGWTTWRPQLPDPAQPSMDVPTKPPWRGNQVVISWPMSGVYVGPSWLAVHPHDDAVWSVPGPRHHLDSQGRSVSPYCWPQVTISLYLDQRKKARSGRDQKCKNLKTLEITTLPTFLIVCNFFLAFWHFLRLFAFFAVIF